MDYRTENGATLDYNYGSQAHAVTAVPGGQSFGYDASGQRVKTVQPDGRILYTPFPTYEEEVWPVAATTPVVTLTANGQTAVTIPPNTAFTLQWQASNAFACEAGGSWSGSKPLNGSQNFKGFNSGSRGTVHLHFEIRRVDNVDLDAENPFRSQLYWPATATELTINFVDIGPLFGYSDTYVAWAASHP